MPLVHPRQSECRRSKHTGHKVPFLNSPVITLVVKYTTSLFMYFKPPKHHFSTSQHITNEDNALRRASLP